jgi:hypothetical protein
MKIPGLRSSSKMAAWFLNEKKPYESRSTFNTKKIGWIFGGGVGIGIISVLFTPTEKAKQQDSQAQSPPTPSQNQDEGEKERGERMAPPSDPTSGGRYTSNTGVAMQSRNRNANQVIRRSSLNSDSLGMIPMGAATGAKLVNAVVSANSTSPVVAVIQSEQASEAIPAGSRAIGNAKFDEQSKRISIGFHTIVYPDGEQHAVQAIAMMPDGSAGLEGDYSSGEGKRQVGRFFGYFIGGLAEGLKTKSQGSAFSSPFEPGSLRNGVLNGVSQSAEDQAHQYSDSMGNSQASMSLPAGLDFVFYFEREFNP